MTPEHKALEDLMLAEATTPWIRSDLPKHAAMAQIAREALDALEQIPEVRDDIGVLVAPNSAWRDVVRLAYAEGGDGARNIQAITSEYVAMRDLLAVIRAAAEPVREWWADRPWPTDPLWTRIEWLLAAIDEKPRETGGEK